MVNSKEIPLEHGGYYHIYNRGNNGERLFHTPANYQHFLRLYDKYIDPIADTFAWCLMGNHFHLFVRIKEEGEIGYWVDLNASGSVDSGRFKWKTSHNLPESEGPGSVMGTEGQGNVMGTEGPGSVMVTEGTGSVMGTEGQGVVNRLKPVPHRMFGHLFNAYAKYLNLRVGRTGSLFEKNFHRIPVDSDRYFQNLVVYIHQNPVHHGFTDDFRDYPWSSYGSIISAKATKLRRKEVLDWFDGRENFIYTHKLIVDGDIIEHLTKGF